MSNKICNSEPNRLLSRWDGGVHSRMRFLSRHLGGFLTLTLVMVQHQYLFVYGRTWRDIVPYHQNVTITTIPPGMAMEKEVLSVEEEEKNSDTPMNPPPPPPSNIFDRNPPTMVPANSNNNGVITTRSPSAMFEQPTTPTDAAAPTTLPATTGLAKYPQDSETPPRPPGGYFNYDTSSSSRYGPGFPVMEYTQEDGFMVFYNNNGWASSSTMDVPDDNYYYWDEFGPQGFGAWKDTLTEREMRRNQCGNVGRQSPIDIRLTGVACVERHQIRTLPGDFRVTGSAIDKQILPNKLRLHYQRRPCADFVNDLACAEPDPPHADFPNGWPGFSDTLHVDFKFPSEHRIYGQTFDGEMQIYHLHPRRKRLPVISVLIQATPASSGGNNWDEGHNDYLQQAIDEFQYKYNVNRAHCGSSVVSSHLGTASRRKLSSEMNDFGEMRRLLNVTKRESATMFESFLVTQDNGEFSGVPDIGRRRLSKIWHPYEKSVMPSYYFFGYDGSLTEPPCSEIVSWFVMDTPMTISSRQLEQMKSILFTNVDRETCTTTSVHYQGSAARPIQESGGRQVWRCTRDNFVPDHERQN